MKKEIKDYLHFYLGQGVEYLDYFDNTRKIGIIESAGLNWFFVKENDNAQEYIQALLVLRPLSDMTTEETSAYNEIMICYKPKLAMRVEAQLTVYLLSKGFDLFGLLESGLAIEVKNQQEKI